MIGDLRPLAASDSARVRALLSRSSDRDVYLCGLVWRLGVVLPAAAGELLGWFRGNELHGVFLHSSVAVLSCDDDEGVDAFADWTAGHMDRRPLLQAVSPEWMVARFLARLDAVGALPPLRLDRSHMPLLRLSRGLFLPRAELRVPEGVPLPAQVRNASEAEQEIVREACRAVTLEELAIDPEALDPLAFRSALTQRVRGGREYLWMHQGRLLFRAALSAATVESALVEGVYTPPEQRGRGFGTAGMHALCERLLRFHKRVVLFVAADNVRAQALYRRLGFVQFGEYRASYFLAPPP
jgi:L-amino acid N-acyltransferase YncA